MERRGTERLEWKRWGEGGGMKKFEKSVVINQEE